MWPVLIYENLIIAPVPINTDREAVAGVNSIMASKNRDDEAELGTAK